MTEGRATFLRVGVLVIAGIGALIGLIAFFGGDRIRNGQNFETYFSESVQGLEVGAAVKFRGVTLGQVTQIGLVSAAYDSDVAEVSRTDAFALVFARFRVDLSKIGKRAPMQDAIKRGLRARLATQGITGISYLELDFVSPEANPPLVLQWQPRDTYLPSIPSTLMQVQDAAQQLLEKLNTIDLAGFVGGVSGLLADLRGQLEHGDVHTLLAQASQALRQIDTAVQAANLPGLASEGRHALQAVGTAADGRPTRQLIGNANQAVARLNALEARLSPLVAAMQATVQRADNGTADLQQGIVPVLRDLQATLANLRETSAQLRRDPGQVLFGAAPPRPQGTSR